MKKVLTIGIPAHNEEKSIQRILDSVIKQEITDVIVKNIVVYSDGSTDRTNTIVKNIKNARLKLIYAKTRKGKTHAIKKLLRFAARKRSDYLLLIDADSRIKNPHVFARLVSDITKDDSLIAVSGRRQPLQPKNFIQKIAHFGFVLWEYLIAHSGKKEAYFRSSDGLICLRVNAYTKAKIERYTYMHDEFFYLFAKKQGKQFGFDTSAKIYFLLPSTLHDYIIQTTRYISKHMNKRDAKYLGSGYTFSLLEKFSAIPTVVKKYNYLIVGCYVFLQLFIYSQGVLGIDTFTNLWIPIESTK